jgi:hypothetical protein
MRQLNLTFETVDDTFGIKGLSNDSFFSQGIILRYDGFLFELTEICGDQLFFKRAWETPGNQKIAAENFDFFYNRQSDTVK